MLCLINLLGDQVKPDKVAIPVIHTSIEITPNKQAARIRVYTTSNEFANGGVHCFPAGTTITNLSTRIFQTLAAINVEDFGF